MAALGELKSPWHNCQMAWLENHLDIINRYSQALENLDSYDGKCQGLVVIRTHPALARGVLENKNLKKQWTQNRRFAQMVTKLLTFST